MNKHSEKDRYTDIDSEESRVRDSGTWMMTRRLFLKSSAMAAAAFCIRPVSACPEGSKRDIKLCFGIVTDSHYADIDTLGTRYYRESFAKMAECIELMNEQQVDFLIHLGDFKNGAPDNSIENLEYFESLYAQFNGSRYHVLGNHDVDSISKPQFQSIVENTGISKDATYYSFDTGGVHFVVLDANFRSDGTAYDTGNFHWTDANIPEEQLDWLENDLSGTGLPVIICAHQLLDQDEGDHYVRNAAEVRRILERHPGVLSVFQGHQHQGQYNRVNGIHFYTLKAMVEGSGKENNAYAVVEVYDDLALAITGYRKSESRRLESQKEIR